MSDEFNKVADDYTKTMNLISSTIEKYNSKEEVLMYLNAVETSVHFSKTTARQVFRNKK